MSISAVFIVYGIGYHLAGNYDQPQVFAGAISLSSFIMLLPFGQDESMGTFIPISKLGAEGMFVGILTALIATEIYCRIGRKGFTIKMPDSVPPMIAQSFVAIIPGAAPLFIFNVSEPMTFGLPVVLNPIAFIPWILAPLASTTISYFAIAVGLVPRPIGATVVWTTPILFSGWVGTGSIAGAILQIVTVVVMTVIWVPFLMAMDKEYLKEEQNEKHEDHEQSAYEEKLENPVEENL